MRGVPWNRWPYIVHVRCQVCGSKDLWPFYSVEEVGFSYLMMRCASCGHAQVGRTQLPPHQKQELRDYFGDVDNESEEAWAVADKYWGTWRAPAFRNILGNLASLGFGRGRLLDVGCAFGHFLALARGEGYEVIGVDPSPAARRWAARKFGLQTAAHLDEVPEKYAPFDVIVCAETLYLLPDVRSVLEQMRRLLRPEGCLVLKMRCNRTVLFRLAAATARLRGRLHEVRPDGRLFGWGLRAFHLFTTRGVHRLLGATGFQPLRTVNEEHAGPLGLSALGLATRCWIAASAAISTASLGKVKVGLDITVYAVPAAGCPVSAGGARRDARHADGRDQ
jgi:SAM-dependent methyltransferase